MRTLIMTKSLHDNVTKPSIGDFINVASADELSVQITGSSTDFLINFECSLDGKNFVPIEGHTICSCGIYSTSLTKNNKIMSFDVADITYFRCNITTLNSGNISAFANAYGLS